MISENNNKFIKPLKTTEKTYILMCNGKTYKINGKIVVLKKTDDDNLAITLYCYYDQAAYPNFTYEYYLEDDTEMNGRGIRCIKETGREATKYDIKFNDKIKQHNLVRFSGRRGVHSTDCLYAGESVQ